MTSLDVNAALDAMGSARTVEPDSVRFRSKARRHSQRAGLVFAAATLAAAVIAFLTVADAGQVVWLATAYVALVLLLEFATTRPSERVRSLRPAKHLIVIGGAILLTGAAFEWITTDELRGVFFVIAASAGVVAVAVVTRGFTHEAQAVLLVGGRVGVGKFLMQWGPRADIEIRGICLSEYVDGSEKEMLGTPVLGSFDDVARVAGDLGVDEVVVAPGPLLGAHDVRRLSWALEGSVVELSVAADVHGAVPHRIQPRILGRRLLLSVRPGKRPRLAWWIKGAMDCIGSAVLVLVLSPCFLVLAIMIRRDSPGPAIFKQTRVGLDGTPFTMYKMRTMVVGAESLRVELLADNEGAGPLFKMAQDPRTTRFGAFLRRTSLDELPQLFNVIKGDMSLIGPRPCLPNEFVDYDDWVCRRLCVKPGITGAWQVNGRSNLSWQDSVRLDIDYVDNWTFREDFRIAAKTARAVVTRDGAL